MYKLGSRSKQRLQGVNPQLIECIERALSKSKYYMTIPKWGGTRTDKEQNEIFQDGFSTCDGYEKRSYHQSGNASDIIPVEGGYSNIKHMLHFAQLMFSTWQEMIYQGEAKGILQWGGFWGKEGWDKPHYQVIGL